MSVTPLTVTGPVPVTAPATVSEPLPLIERGTGPKSMPLSVSAPVLRENCRLVTPDVGQVTVWVPDPVQPAAGAACDSMMIPAVSVIVYAESVRETVRLLARPSADATVTLPTALTSRTVDAIICDTVATMSFPSPPA